MITLQFILHLTLTIIWTAQVMLSLNQKLYFCANFWSVSKIFKWPSACKCSLKNYLWFAKLFMKKKIYIKLNLASQLPAFLLFVFFSYIFFFFMLKFMIRTLKTNIDVSKMLGFCLLAILGCFLLGCSNSYNVMRLFQIYTMHVK